MRGRGLSEAWRKDIDMTLKEFYGKVGGDYEDVCERLGGPEVIGPIVKMLLTDRHYENCRQALIAKDLDSAFCAVHALKGICMNLDIRNLMEDAAELTEVLREGQREPDRAPAAFSALQSTYRDVIDALKELED